MTNAIKIFNASKHYSDLLACFSTHEKLKVDLDGRELSEAIYFHICKMKYAGWKHRVDFERKRKHSLSEFFQDIIAFYLKTTLPSNYQIKLEHKIGDTQPDIAIKLGNKYLFLIEVKTTIGWARPDEEFKKRFEKRIDKLSKNFDVPRENIIYIFEEPNNVSKEFLDKFWNKELQKPEERPEDFPYSIIFPLFNATDPYYWKHRKGLQKDKEYVDLSDEEICGRAQKSIVTPFEEILKIIKTASQSR